jgi:hypothetical protein
MVSLIATPPEERSMTALTLHPNAAASLQRWHQLIAEGDLSTLPGCSTPRRCSAH